MRRFAELLTPILVLIGVLAACSSGQGSTEKGAVTPIGKSPSIIVDKDILDFGKVQFEQWVKPTFQISNVGDADLHVTQVSVTTLEGC